MSRRKAALTFSFLMMVSLLNSMAMEYENFEESSILKSTISSDYNNNSTVDMGPAPPGFSNSWGFGRAFIHNWSSSDGFILLATEGANSFYPDLYLKKIYKNDSFIQQTLSLSGSGMYHIHSIKVDENGIIHIGKRTELLYWELILIVKVLMIIMKMKKLLNQQLNT